MRLPPWQVTVAIIGVGVVWYASKVAAKGVQTSVSAVLDAINPISAGNIVYQGVNSVGGVIAGSPTYSVGSAIYEATHPSEPDPTAPVEGVKLIGAAKGFDTGTGIGW